MFGKRFEKELKMIENALNNDQDKLEFKLYLKPLVEAIVDKYAAHESAKGIPRTKLVMAGWTHFDYALRGYKEKVDLMKEKKIDHFYFSTYFTWFVRQGVVEYLKSLDENE